MKAGWLSLIGKQLGILNLRVKDIWKYVRVKSVDGQLVPYFLPEAETPLSALESAEKRLVENRSAHEEVYNSIQLTDQYVKFFLHKKVHKCT